MPLAEFCDYGCGNIARFINKSNRSMCESSANKCPINRKKNSIGLSAAHKAGKMPKIKNQGWSKNLTKETDLRVLKNSKAREGKPSTAIWTEEARKKLSENKKQFLKDYPEKNVNSILAGNRNRMSYPEKIAFDWLIKNEKNFIRQKKILQYFVDFCIGNCIIEIDGEYWHPENNERDRIRDEKLKKEGYLVFHIRSKEQIEKRLEELFADVMELGYTC